jgi:hypothetical protein
MPSLRASDIIFTARLSAIGILRINKTTITIKPYLNIDSSNGSSSGYYHPIAYAKLAEGSGSFFDEVFSFSAIWQWGRPQSPKAEWEGAQVSPAAKWLRKTKTGGTGSKKLPAPSISLKSLFESTSRVITDLLPRKFRVVASLLDP